MLPGSHRRGIGRRGGAELGAHRAMSRETITAAFATCRQAGLGTLSYNIVGLPGEGPRETVSSPPPLFFPSAKQLFLLPLYAAAFMVAVMIMTVLGVALVAYVFLGWSRNRKMAG